ncbi:hypothetical protein ACFSTC_47525 [Nonomuraea ferruginea]
MRRYRFGWVAAVVAGGFVVAVVVSGAVAAVTDDGGHLWLLTGVLGQGPGGWATVLPMVALGGCCRAGGLWQILRGRSMKEKAELGRGRSSPAGRPVRVAALRVRPLAVVGRHPGGRPAGGSGGAALPGAQPRLHGGANGRAGGGGCAVRWPGWRTWCSTSAHSVCSGCRGSSGWC